MRNRSFALAILFAIGFSSAAGAVEVAFERDTSLPLVYLNVAVETGAISDPDGKSGITNFVGEMLIRGTKARTKEQIDLELDQMGGRLEVEVRTEALIIRGAVLADHLGDFLQLVTDVVTQPSFPEREIRKLKGEVISQILEELGDDSALGARKLNEFLFQGHPYGKPVLGRTQDVDSFTREDIAAQYDRLFKEKQLLVVGTGDADKSRIQAWADRLAELRPGGAEFEKVQAPKDPPKRELLIVDKPDRTQTQIYGGQVGIRMTDKDFFPLYVGNHAFGGGSFSARLMAEIRVKRGWSYGAYSYFRQGRQPRSWQYHLFPASKDTPPALGYTLEMLAELKAKGITKDEFDFAQQSLVNSAGFMFNTPRKRVENLLLERTLDLPDGFMKTYGPEIEKVTLDQVNHALKDFVKPDRQAIVVVGTASQLKEPLAKAVGIPVAEVKVVPYTQE